MNRSSNAEELIGNGLDLELIVVDKPKTNQDKINEILQKLQLLKNRVQNNDKQKR